MYQPDWFDLASEFFESWKFYRVIQAIDEPSAGLLWELGHRDKVSSWTRFLPFFDERPDLAVASGEKRPISGDSMRMLSFKGYRNQLFWDRQHSKALHWKKFTKGVWQKVHPPCRQISLHAKIPLLGLSSITIGKKQELCPAFIIQFN